MSAENINKKIEITWKAVEIYEKKGKITIPDLVSETGMTASEIYTFFPNKKAILNYYYPALVYQYMAMIEEIDGFENFDISEKFSNFVYTIFDMLNEHPAFVEDTFEKYILPPGEGKLFKGEVKALFKEFLTTDGDIAVSAAFFMKGYFYDVLVGQYTLLIRYWLHDTSDNKERTLALTDKLAALFEEAVYNKTVDKGFDLIKFIFGQFDIEKKLPKWDNCSWEKDHHEDTKGEDKDE